MFQIEYLEAGKKLAPFVRRLTELQSTVLEEYSVGDGDPYACNMATGLTQQRGQDDTKNGLECPLLIVYRTGIIHT